MVKRCFLPYTGSMSLSTGSGNGKAIRTRRDIVQAAISCWAADNSRSVGEVAETAGVGRTTVNRYFPSRAELVAAVDAECRDRFHAAMTRARPGEDDGLTALQRVCAEIVQLGPVLGLIFADNALIDPDSWTEDEGDDPLGTVIVRGQSDGSIAADLPAEWVAINAWTSLFAAHLMLQTGSTTRYEVSQLLIRTLASGLTA